MAKPYSQDLRERVIEAVEAGHTQSEAARMFKISLRTVVGYMSLWHTTGKVAPKKFGGHKKHRLAEHADTVKALVKAAPDQTLAELQDRLDEAGIEVSKSALDRFLKASKITYKKNAVRRRAKAGRRR
jgi:putative transposase